jgi:hypothetical protein
MCITSLMSNKADCAPQRIRDLHVTPPPPPHTHTTTIQTPTIQHALTCCTMCCCRTRRLHNHP